VQLGDALAVVRRDGRGATPGSTLGVKTSASSRYPLVDREALHLLRPRHDNEDDLSSMAAGIESVGNGDELAACGAEFLDDREGVANAGACQAVEAKKDSAPQR
jgi:hypothetical protein